MKLRRRPLKTIKVPQPTASKPYGSPAYLNPVANAGGTTRDVPVVNYTTSLLRRPG